MKNFLFALFLALFASLHFSSSVNAADMALLDNAVTRAYTKKLTIHSVTADFKPDNNIRRDEAAKFFVTFAKLVGKTNYTVNASQCQFTDTNQAWADLREIIVESCRLGIFNWSNGKFDPTGNLTNAQAVAVLLRIVDGYQSESWVSHWSDNYYKRANELKVLANVNMSSKTTNATRGNMVTLLYDARGMKGVNTAPLITQDKNYLVDSDIWGYACSNESSYSAKWKQLSEKYKNYKIVKKDCNWNLNRYVLWEKNPSRYPTDWAACFELRVYDTKKDTSLCEGVNSLHQSILKKNYSNLSIPDYGILNESGYRRNRIEWLNFSKYLPSCEMLLREIANIDTSCDEDVYPTITYQEFIKPITYLLYEEYKNDYGKISYKNGYITVELNSYTDSYRDEEIWWSFLYHAIDSQGIYKLYSDAVIWEKEYTYNSIDGWPYWAEEIEQYDGWLIGRVRKENGYYPRLRQFSKTITSEQREKEIGNYMYDLLEWKQTSAYFTEQLNVFKVEIDKLYQS